MLLSVWVFYLLFAETFLWDVRLLGGLSSNAHRGWAHILAGFVMTTRRASTRKVVRVACGDHRRARRRDHSAGLFWGVVAGIVGYAFMTARMTLGTAGLRIIIYAAARLCIAPDRAALTYSSA